jgi:glycosyltransferase involved in cell wall biosynthesis
MSKPVLIFSLAYYPRFVSGAEAAVREITDRISSSEIEFHMITLRFDMKDPKEESIGNVRVHRVGFGPSYLSKMCYIPQAALCGLRLHRTHTFAAMWAMMTYMLFPVMLMRLCGVTIPYALTLQDGDPYKKVFERWFIRPFTWILDRGFRGATVVQVISDFLSTWVRERGYTGRIVKIYNGADPRDVDGTVTVEEVNTLTLELGKREGDVFLINTARLEHQKGFDTVIRALPLLPPHIKFLAVGGGRDEQALRSLAAQLAVSDRVMFIPKVSRDRVSVYRKVADIFVAPSRSEGLGIAQLSALATPLPLVSTCVGGLSEFVIEDEAQRTAWVIKPDDPQAICDKVRYVLAHPEEVRTVSQRARALILEQFEWDAIALSMKREVFDPLLGHV